VNENTGKIDRIQVKTSRHQIRYLVDDNRLMYNFQLNPRTVKDNSARAGSEGFIIFVMLSPGFPKSWTYVVMQKAVLLHTMREHGLGRKPTKQRGHLGLLIEIEKDGKTYFVKRGKKVSLSDYQGNWSFWPPIPPHDG